MARKKAERKKVVIKKATRRKGRKKKAPKPRRKPEEKKYIILYDQYGDDSVLARNVTLEEAQDIIREKASDDEEKDGDEFEVFEIGSKMKVDLDWSPRVTINI